MRDTGKSFKIVILTRAGIAFALFEDLQRSRLDGRVRTMQHAVS